MGYLKSVSWEVMIGSLSKHLAVGRTSTTTSLQVTSITASPAQIRYFPGSPDAISWFHCAAAQAWQALTSDDLWRTPPTTCCNLATESSMSSAWILRSTSLCSVCRVGGHLPKYKNNL